MYGLIPMYAVEAQPLEDAETEGKNLAREDLPDDVAAGVLDTSVTGDPHLDTHLSVEVEVVFPDADSEDDLPPRDELFPSAEGVSFLAVEEAE